jgi:hypothetical protein
MHATPDHLRTGRRTVALALALALLFGRDAVAAPMLVTTASDAEAADGACSLREAVSNANNNAATHPDCPAGDAAQVDSVTFAPPVAHIVIGSGGNLVFTDPAGIVLDGEGRVTLDGNAANRIVFVIPNAVSTLRGVTFTRGFVAGFETGGCVMNRGWVRLERVTMSHCRASYGGAIYSDSTYSASFALPRLVVRDGLFFDNHATMPFDANGGGGGLPHGGDGGAIYVWGPSNQPLDEFDIDNTTFRDNTAIYQGGGLFAFGSGRVTASSFSGNAAIEPGEGRGGGLMVRESFTLARSTVAGNAASVGGGFFAAGNVSVTDSTLAGNSATLRGANLALGIGYVTRLQRTLLADPVTTANCTTAATAQNLGDNVQSGDGSCNGITQGSVVLGPLQDNGGDSWTRVPARVGAAVDAIACPASPAADQRGVSRPQGASCDIGAVERRSAQLRVIVTGAGSATASSVPAPLLGSINGCSSTGGNACLATYDGDAAPATQVTLQFAPGTGLAVTSIAGTCGGVRNADSYTTDAIHADCTVEVEFGAAPVALTVISSAGGSLTPSGASAGIDLAYVPQGTQVEFTATPFAGFVFATASGCGGTRSGNLFTTAPVTSACTVDAQFARLPVGAVGTGTPLPTLDAAEGDGGLRTLSIPLLLSQMTADDVMLHYQLGAAAGSAGVPSADFSGVTGGTITFAPGATAQTLALTIRADASVEPDEAFRLTFSIGSSLPGGGPNATLSPALAAGLAIVLRNDDSATISVADIAVAEDAGPASFSIVLDQPVQGGFTLPYGTQDDGAVAGQDYTASTGELQHDGNPAMPASILVTLRNDVGIEPDESFELQFGAAACAWPACAVATPSASTAVIVDDDALRTVFLDGFEGD